MDDEETRETMQGLINQIQEKSVQLSDLEIVIEDYQRERQALLREIGQLKASLWELSAEASLPARTPRANLSSNQTGDQPAA
jgi:hypothetical protein